MERGAWTNGRLDDLVEGTRAGFNRLDQDIRDLRGEVGEVRRDLTIQIGTVNGQVGALRTESSGQIEALRQLLFRVGSALLVTLVGVIAAILLRGA